MSYLCRKGQEGEDGGFDGGEVGEIEGCSGGHEVAAAAETGGYGGDGEAGIFAAQGNLETVVRLMDEHGDDDAVDAAEDIDDAFVFLEGEVMSGEEFGGDIGVGELAAAGVNIIIYANQLLRAAYPAMKKCAERILECDRAQEASEESCMSIAEIVSLI